MSKFAILLVLAAAGCATVATYQGQRLDELYGQSDPARYDRRAPSRADLDFQRDVKPILDGRCVVCHGCYDSACQLNLASFEGVTRGASKDMVYAPRLKASEPTRMFMDALSNAGSDGWRAKGFFPVLNERAAGAEADREGSVLYRSLRLKRAHPPVEGAPLPAGRFDFSLDRAQQCPAVEAMDTFEKNFADWGMPFGLPGLTEREQGILTRWIEAGAPHQEAAPLPAAFGQRIAQWEAFLNGDSLKERLAARYIYEHWFVGHLYFDDLPDSLGSEFFQLVRSKTPPGRPIELIATRRPYDDPGVERVYYRLRRVTETALTKTHMPYALNPARMARFKAWFLDAPYEVTALPSYAPESASNPFVTFEQLPVNSRYRFMLDEAQFILMGFIKGPVCRGQVALNVIDDHFWVLFVEPDDAEADVAFLSRERNNLRLPSEQESNAGMLTWTRYAGREAEYLAAKSRYLKQRLSAANPPTLDLIWDGEGRNPNAALTVFRHYDSASVVQGLIGERPQTVLVMSYALFERIHYLLVAGFDVHGSAGHQLATRLYMDFLRMEGEQNFFGLLPRAARQAVRDRWYRDAPAQHVQYLQDTRAYYDGETGIRFRTGDPLTELYALLKERAAKADTRRYAIESSGVAGAPLSQLAELSGVRGKAVSHLPEVAFLTLRGAGKGDLHYTLLVNRAHRNVAVVMGEDRRLLPDEDTLSVLTGFVGGYPNAFLEVEAKDLPAFVGAVRGLAAESDYDGLFKRYGVPRTGARFWAHSDEVHRAYRQWAPKEAGVFDYNRLENR